MKSMSLSQSIRCDDGGASKEPRPDQDVTLLGRIVLEAAGDRQVGAPPTT
jgi:hypothetical protein